MRELEPVEEVELVGRTRSVEVAREPAPIGREAGILLGLNGACWGSGRKRRTKRGSEGGSLGIRSLPQRKGGER